MSEQAKTAQRQLEELSREVSREHRTMRDAIEAERGAKAALLDLMLLAVAPALPDIVSKVPASAHGPSGEYGREPEDFFEFRGVLVAGTAGPNPPDARVAFERLNGKGLYAVEPGRFVEVTYEGEFLRDGNYSWAGRHEFLTTTEVAGKRWPIGEIFETLAEEMAVQIEGKQKATAKSVARLKTVQAAADMLKGIR